MVSRGFIVESSRHVDDQDIEKPITRFLSYPTTLYQDQNLGSCTAGQDYFRGQPTGTTLLALLPAFLRLAL